MYAAIFAAGALGYGLNLLSLTIERRFVHWAGECLAARGQNRAINLKGNARTTL